MNSVRQCFGVLLLPLLVSVPILAQPMGLPEDLSGDHEARGFADLLFTHGILEFDTGNYEAALPLLAKAAHTLPNDGTYSYFAALCKLQLGQFGEAAEGFRQALPPVESRISEARIRYDLGDAYYRGGDLANAQKQFRASTAIDDRLAPAHYFQGLVDFQQGDTDSAYKAFSKALILDPSYAEQEDLSRAMSAYRAGNIEQARTHFEKAVKNASQAGLRQTAEWMPDQHQADKSEEVPKTAARFTIVMEHDDNPGQVNEDVTLPGIPSDLRAVALGRAAYRPWLKENSTVSLVASGYVSRHRDFEAADLTGLQGIVNVVIGGDPTGFISGPLGYARTTPSEKKVGWLFQGSASNLSRKEGSLRRDFEFATTAVVQMGDFGKAEASVSYDDAHYFGEFNQPFSGDSIGYRVGQYIFLRGERSRYVRLSVGLTQHDTQEAAYERDSMVYQAEFSWPLNDTFHLFMLSAFRKDEYDAASAPFYLIARPRVDETVEAIAKLTMTLNPKSFLSFGYSFGERDNPDLEFVRYDRRIASVSFTRQW